jgi:hypothetical protein
MLSPSPREPVEDVFFFEQRGELRVRACEVVERFRVTVVAVRHFPETIFDFAIDEVID